MGGKKLKASNGDGTNMRQALNKSKLKKNEEEEHSQKNVDSAEKLPKLKEKKKKDKSSEKRRNSLEEAGVRTVETKKSKLKNKKRQREKVVDAEIDEPSDDKEITEEKKEIEGEVGEEIITPKKAKKKKRKNDKIGEADAVNDAVNNEVKQQKGKSKKARRAEKKDQMLSNKNEKEKVRVEEDYEVYEMSSGDEDLAAGMTKWVSEYHKSRPGLEILQQRIDDFITDHDKKEEQAREEKEARMAEDGWTYVGPQKGRKKTADSDGVVVGSVAEAAVRDKVSKKETKLVGSDFYRFQKREAHRNEIMKLQSKFEEDKKRIQQMRATRKFRPY